MKTLIVFLLTLAVWSYPAKTAGAILTPQNLEEIKINYGPHEQILRSNTQSEVDGDVSPKNHSTIKSGHAVHIAESSSHQTSYSGRNYSKEEVIALIEDYSRAYRVGSAVPLAIARCESGYNQFSANSHSSARGVYQWLTSSWKNQPASKGGTISPFDADANISAAVWLIAHNQTSPWNASRSCWNK